MNAVTAQSLVATFAANIARIETALASAKPGQFIFAWVDYGIGAAIIEGDPRVVCVSRAMIVKANSTLVFTNGAGKRAALVDRATALRTALALVQNTMANVQGRLAA